MVTCGLFGLVFWGQKREPATLVLDIPGSASNIREQGHLSLLYAARPAVSLFSIFVTVTLILKSNIRKLFQFINQRSVSIQF